MKRAAALSIFLIAACGRQGYPPEYEFNFMQACEAQSRIQGLCACTWEMIEAEVAPADFAALERLPPAEREAHPLKLQIDGYALVCARELTSETPAQLPSTAP